MNAELIVIIAVIAGLVASWILGYIVGMRRTNHWQDGGVTVYLTEDEARALVEQDMRDALLREREGGQ